MTQQMTFSSVSRQGRDTGIHVYFQKSNTYEGDSPVIFQAIYCNAHQKYLPRNGLLPDILFAILSFITSVFALYF
jgi:hypothetical protein